MDKQLDLALGSLGINEPYSIEAEQAILGAALISPETVSLIIEQVRAEYFYSRQNQKIFLEIHKLFNANMPSDFITVLLPMVCLLMKPRQRFISPSLPKQCQACPMFLHTQKFSRINTLCVCCSTHQQILSNRHRMHRVQTNCLSMPNRKSTSFVRARIHLH